MKKIVFPFLIMISGVSMAQVTFNPGIRTGVNFSNFIGGKNENFYIYEGTGQEKVTHTDLRTVTDFYLGLEANIRFSKYYALQPEINYSRQGTSLQYTTENGVMPRKRLQYNFIGLQLTNKLYIQNFNILAGPFLDLSVGKHNSGLDLGFTGGLGYDLSENLGFEARIKKGFISMLDNGDSFFVSGNSNTVFQIGAHYTFHFKK